MTSLMTDLRTAYLHGLCAKILGRRGRDGYASFADKDSAVSRQIAERILTAMPVTCTVSPLTAQAAGAEFARITHRFLQDSFACLQRVRPGTWRFSTEQTGIAAYRQYEHLAELMTHLNQHPDLKAHIGADYLVTPDIVITRQQLADREFLTATDTRPVVSADVAQLTDLRATGSTPGQILHASVSCKWTMRSDRAQNSRTEALNLIRNRKGRTPHIAVVTCEPMPSRIASIALGTGDIDCTYHAVLYELVDAVRNCGYADSLELLQTMIAGRRLRDISDLPLDLAV